MKLTRTFKRKGGARRSLNFNPKKRRVARRGRKTTNFTSQSGSGGGLRFRSKKVGRRAYKKHLWNSTLFKEHYRSNNAVTQVIATSTNPSQLVNVAESALVAGVNPFYIAAGGAVSPDATQAMPTFNGDVTIRGGMIGLRITNSLDSTLASSNTLQGTAFLIRTTKNWVGAAIPVAVSVGWDPTLIQDFDTRVGRILYKKNFLLKDGDAALIEYRLGVQKVDIGDFVNTYNTYVWIIMAGNVDGAVTHSLNYTKYWNLSFSADAI